MLFDTRDYFAKAEKVEMLEGTWWDKRLTYPMAQGHISSSEAPDHSDFYPVSGGRHMGFTTAARLIEAFEIGVFQSGVPQFQLMNVELREKISTFDQRQVPLCPNPATTDPEQVPDRMRSLGIFVDYSKYYEIWFIARIALAEAGFTWRLDWTIRAKNTAQAVGWLSLLLHVYNAWHGGPDVNLMEGAAKNASQKAGEYLPILIKVWTSSLDKIESLDQYAVNRKTVDQNSMEQPNRRD